MLVPLGEDRGTDVGVDFNVAQEAHDVEDTGETMLSFYDLDADRDYEANDVHVGQQAQRVCTHMFALEAHVLWPCLVGTVSSVCRTSHVQALMCARLHFCGGALALLRRPLAVLRTCSASLWQCRAVTCQLEIRLSSYFHFCWLTCIGCKQGVGLASTGEGRCRFF